ncbi:MAG: flavodoxin domain-containing protein [Ilumatobacter sp.]|uniref:flavodoxin family protein n=1 Tax=Ilumatobacter sp. TaxID=1967498 RepID=UPI00260CED94|nr:flavodoxin domain-containing protein [Ilumatobacter sp.]MDJ0769228.1 flavodoxin domain-containing protein [Ilumatobacter sp.]
MRALVVYESMFGNTHTVADRVAAGLRTELEVTVVPATEATHELVDAHDCLIVGGPTHAHGLSSARSRETAAETAAKEPDLELEPDAEGAGLRDWFDGLGYGRNHRAAAFDTRVDAPAALTGRASKGINRRLVKHGFQPIVEPESFLVDKHNHLLPAEDDRAEAWGADLAHALLAVIQHR